MRAGLAALDLWTDDAIDRLNRLGDALRSELRQQGWTVAGRGSLMRIHVSEPDVLWWSLYDRGVLLAANGLACLSTPMDDAVISEVARAFADVRTQQAWS
jgi:glutamate-1-semialdehyde 2,1-aminomutase